MKFEIEKAEWMNPLVDFSAEEKSLEFHTALNTDLWQRTYYGFRNDNSPALLYKAEISQLDLRSCIWGAHSV